MHVARSRTTVADKMHHHCNNNCQMTNKNSHGCSIVSPPPIPAIPRRTPNQHVSLDICIVRADVRDGVSGDALYQHTSLRHEGLERWTNRDVFKGLVC